MKVTVKPLKGEPFTIDMEPEETVQALKAKVAAARPELPAELQKVIFSGKVLMDPVTMQEGSVGDGDFVVIMTAKAPAAPAPPAPPPAAPEAAPAAAAPAPPPPAPPAADTYGSAASGMLTGEGLETSIQMLCDMGFPRDMVVRCLRAAFNNPDRAVDYLMNGIPPHLQQQASGAPPAPPANPLGPMAPPAPGAGALPSMPAAPPAAPVTGPLAPLANHPRFAQLRAAVQQKPQHLHYILTLIAQADPNLITLVAEHQEEFVKLLAEAPAAAVPNDPIAAMMAAAQAAQAPGAPPAVPGAAAPPAAPLPAPPPPAPPQPPPAPELSPAEQEAIQRLEALGFPRARCVEAYLACERNEELAASYLFDAMDES
eukprot:TRINITY_DN57855_c0_g1_i1.p1 TRINITY_DN57855_c0_g1~~TRINITY_DN57855_c0_g1_i1.p1  ORF type:complete len:371 (-),score=95.31 TRINITY_DN57855_c0_g1_i1:59-1171(-)